MPIADLPGIGTRIRTSARGHRIGDVLGQRGDPLDLDRRAELDLVPRHRRAAGEAGDLGVDLELVEHRRQRLDDAGRWRRCRALCGLPGARSRGSGSVYVTSPASDSCSTRAAAASWAAAPAAPLRAGPVRPVRRSRWPRRPRGRDGLGPVARFWPGREPRAGDGVDEGGLLERLVADPRAFGVESRAAGRRRPVVGSALRPRRPAAPSVAGEPVHDGSERGGHLVHGVAVMTSRPKSAEEEQQRHGAVDGDGRLQRAGGEEAEDAARSPHPVGPSGGVGMPAATWVEAAGREGQRGRPDGRTRGRRLVLRGAQHPHAEREQHEGHGIADLAESPGDDGVDDRRRPLPACPTTRGPRRRRPGRRGAARHRRAGARARGPGRCRPPCAATRTGRVRETHPGVPHGAHRERQSPGTRALRERPPERAAGALPAVRPWTSCCRATEKTYESPWAQATRRSHRDTCVTCGTADVNVRSSIRELARRLSGLDDHRDDHRPAADLAAPPNRRPSGG